MLSLENAQAAIASEIVRSVKTETVPLAQAFTRYLAKNVCAQVDNPAFDNSAMDGYAVNAEQLVEANFILPLKGESSAGDVPGKLEPGSTMRIFTGAPVPDGADAVVIQEDIKSENGKIVFPHTVQPGQNIRIRGQDFQSGDELFPTGRRLNANDIALLSAAGIAEVTVYCRPRVLFLQLAMSWYLPARHSSRARYTSPTDFRRCCSFRVWVQMSSTVARCATTRRQSGRC